jgi:hypothetical protein
MKQLEKEKDFSNPYSVMGQNPAHPGACPAHPPFTLSCAWPSQLPPLFPFCMAYYSRAKAHPASFHEAQWRPARIGVVVSDRESVSPKEICPHRVLHENPSNRNQK